MEIYVLKRTDGILSVIMYSPCITLGEFIILRNHKLKCNGNIVGYCQFLEFFVMAYFNDPFFMQE